MLDRIRRFSDKIPYYGAGALFACQCPGGWEILLFRRAIDPDCGTWSVAGGRCEPGESYRQAAAREVSEEALGDREMLETLGPYLPPGFTMDAAPEEVQYNIPFIFGWRNYLIVLTEKPPEGVFRLNWENDGLAWYPVQRLPDKAHDGVRSSIRTFRLAAQGAPADRPSE